MSLIFTCGILQCVLRIILRQLPKAQRYQKAGGTKGLTFRMEELLDFRNDSPVIPT